jgi:hypothetical protein
LRLPDDKSKYSNKWKWVELGRYLPQNAKVSRASKKVGNKWVPLTFENTEIEAYADKHDRLGIYSTVFNYDNPDWEKATRLGSVYFDLDNEDVSVSLKDAIVLAEFLSTMLTEDQLRIYFTGKKGYHIECEALAVGVSPSNDLPGIYRLIANDLKEKLELSSIDFAVYDLRRMWRLPNTKHQLTGLYKIPITLDQMKKGQSFIQDLAQNPIPMDVPEQEFSYKANQWYKEFVYKHEQMATEQHSVDDVINWFRKRGTGGNRSGDMEKVFNPVNLFDNCPSIIRLWEKAERDHHLEHEERLFLCSILSYTDEALEYLHMILSNCTDYNLEKSQSHIDDWISRRNYGIGGRPYSCRRANEAGVGCGSCDLEPKKKWVKVGDSFVESEEFSEPSPIRYAYQSVTINKT